jgi:Response regulator containing a CheY-like receiver domain and an HTH DNA-binding domain
LKPLEHYRLLIADDHPLYRGALREAVTGLFERIDIAEAGTFNEVTELLERGSEVDLVLLDLTMPGVRSFSGLMYLRAQYPSVPVIVVSANDDPAAIRRCMEFGASGFIPKTLGVEVMRDAISCILSGGVWTPPDVDLSAGSDAETAALMTRMTTLTPQQVRVLMMLSEGLLNKQIAYQLGVSEATVKAHVSAILQKLGVESRTQAVIAAAKIETGQWSQGAPGRLITSPRKRGEGKKDYSAAATRSTRHCASKARNAAGLIGLCSTWMPSARACSRTTGERSAVSRIDGRSPQRARNATIASMPLP